MEAWIQEFEAYAQKLLGEAKVPGAAIGVARDGKMLYSKTFGYRDREQELPISMDTVFGIASLTKSFTCVAIMQLQEAGKLSVHDPVVKYLPQFRAGEAELSNRMTIHHFMTHTPGMAPLPYLDGAMKRSMEQDPAIVGTEAEEDLKGLPYLDTYEQVMEAIAGFEGKPLGAPGTAFSYNNDAYGLLGAVIEQVSGQPYEEYVTTHILQPLGMHRTVFDVADLDEQEDVTVLYTNKKVEGVEQVIAAPFWHDAPAMRAAGFLKSTVNDLLAYLEVFRTGGENRKSPILCKESVSQMLTPFARCDGYRSYGYGLMVSPAFPDGKLIEHGGSLKGISSHLFTIPETGLTGGILINLDGVAVRELVAGLLNAMALRPTAVPPYPVPHYELADEQLAEYEGRYESSEWTKTLVEKREGALHLEVDGQSYPLIPVGPDSFLFKRRDSHVWIDFFRSPEGVLERMSYSLRQLNKQEKSENTSKIVTT
ncbi:serine hydrolase domain-containing protein [Brevibacillus reuszeri]|uniref:serine hydrolase domain-containing protein n=1 Tax=Brevibacillus reuszeri TaxID=54915 RepID=UPI003D233750